MKRGDLTNGLPPDEQSGGGDSESRPANGLDRIAELKLIDAALLGDMEAFANLFERYRPILYSLCLKRLNDHSLAEDIVQEVFVRAFISLPNSDHRKPIWPWLATIAARMCIDLQRRRSFTHFSEDVGATVDVSANRVPVPDTEVGSALDAVIASERRAEIFRSLRVLPKRQRRVFLLFALDGWSCADIAAVEGISLDAVYHLLFRARRKMRTAYQNGLPALVAVPFAWLHGKVQRTAERVRLLLAYTARDLSTACMQAVCLGTAALIGVAASDLAESLEGADSPRFGEAVLSATQPQPPRTASLQSVSPDIGVSVQAPFQFQQSNPGPASSLIDKVINPNQDATPENSPLASIAASPNYESDHTILALGGWFRVLFASHDGGASWKPLPSRFLFPSTYMVIPPGYPKDRRIFVLGNEVGLQRSDDGGEIFRPVSPMLAWSVTISPSFGSGDSRILMGGTRIFEYDAGTGVTQPVLLSIPLWRGYSSITLSPGYPSDPTLFISQDYAQDPVLYRCAGTVCGEIRLPNGGPPILRLSPRFDRDGLAYAASNTGLFVSNDGARTFRNLQFPLPDDGLIGDVAVLWNKYSEPAIFVYVSGGVFRSLDGGRSWNNSGIDVSDFKKYGANNLIVTPTGRLLATGSRRGIACSEDGGQTWAPRCTPEP